MNDLELELALERSVLREREATTEVLRYLREVEIRRIFLARGFSSLFAYCTKKLGYSEPEAMLRIQAMRLSTAVPAAMKKIESGELSMSVAALVQSTARREELPRERTQELVQELSGTSKREAERKLATLYPEEARPEKVRPVGDRVEIRFTVSAEEAALLQELLDRKAHQNYERSYEKLFVSLATKELEKLRGNEAPPHGPDEVKSRHIPAATRRYIWRRDQARCQYKDTRTGRLCQERHGLQIDHIQPYALGGGRAPENLRLLCAAHNLWRAVGLTSRQAYSRGAPTDRTARS